MLVDGAAHSHKVAKRSVAILTCFFAATLTPQKCEALILKQLPEDFVFAHLDEAAVEMHDEVGADVCLKGNVLVNYTPQRKLAEQFAILFRYSATSIVCYEVLERCIADVSEAIDHSKEWEATCEKDYLTEGNALVLQGDTKRRRMDAALQHALGSAVAINHAAGNTSAFLKAHPNLYSSKHGLRFNQNMVYASISANWLSFARSKHISVVADGVRCGNPASEVLVAMAYDPQRKIGAWLPPMVSCLAV